MITITPTTKPVFLHQKDYCAKFSTPRVDNSAVLNKPTFDPDYDVTRYKSTEGRHIHITFKTKKDYEELMNCYKQSFGVPYSKNGFYMSREDIILAVLGPGDYYANAGDSNWSKNIEEMKKGSASDFFCTVYQASTFTPIPLTKGEQVKLTAAQKTAQKANFHALVAKDVLLTKLNESGFDIVVFNERYLNYNRVKGWNKLVKESIEYYLNNEILKDTGCKIKLPKIKNQHKYNYNDILCDLGDVELDLK